MCARRLGTAAWQSPRSLTAMTSASLRTGTQPDFWSSGSATNRATLWTREVRRLASTRVHTGSPLGSGGACGSARLRPTVGHASCLRLPQRPTPSPSAPAMRLPYAASAPSAPPGPLSHWQRSGPVRYRFGPTDTPWRPRSGSVTKAWRSCWTSPSLVSHLARPLFFTKARGASAVERFRPPGGDHELVGRRAAADPDHGHRLLAGYRHDGCD